MRCAYQRHYLASAIRCGVGWHCWNLGVVKHYRLSRANQSRKPLVHFLGWTLFTFGSGWVSPCTITPEYNLRHADHNCRGPCPKPASWTNKRNHCPQPCFWCAAPAISSSNGGQFILTRFWDIASCEPWCWPRNLIDDVSGDQCHRIGHPILCNSTAN